MPAKKNKIKAIIFDLGGVIVHGGYLDFVKHYCQACLTPLGAKRLAKLEREVNLGLITEKKFYQEIEKTFAVRQSPRQIHRIIVNHMKTDQGLIHLIPKLKPAKIILFTNSIGHMAREVLRKRHLLDHQHIFNQVFDSNVLHMIKPDANAYRYVLHKLKVKPHEALMVDDRLFNIRGARKIGMRGIVYKNSWQFRKALTKYEF